MRGQLITIIAKNREAICIQVENNKQLLSMSNQKFKEKIMSGEYILPCMLNVN